MQVVALKVQNMNSKIIAWGSVATVAVVVTGWFGWTTYQRSVYESFLASAEEMTTKISGDNAPASLDVLGARQKNIDVAISTLNKIPPSSGDIYRRAQERWSKLKELDAQIIQRMENEKLAISSLAKAKVLTNKKSSQTLQERKVIYDSYKEAISLLEKIPADTSVAVEVKKNLAVYRKNSEVVLAEYRKIEYLEKKQYEEERKANAKEQERLAKLRQQRESYLQTAKIIQEKKEEIARKEAMLQQLTALNKAYSKAELAWYCNDNPIITEICDN
jgi:hypothetical protein